MELNSDWVNRSTINQVTDTFHSFEPNQSQIIRFNALASKHVQYNLDYANAQLSNKRGKIGNAERKLNNSARSIASVVNGARGNQNGRATATRHEESTARYVAGDNRAFSLVAREPSRKRKAIGQLTSQINELEQRNQGLRQGLIIPTDDGDLPEYDDTPDEAEARALFYAALDNDISKWRQVREIRGKQYNGLDPAYQTGDLNNPFTDYDKRRRLQNLGVIGNDEDGSLVNKFPWLSDNRPPRTDVEIRTMLPPYATRDEIEHFKSMKDSELYVEYGWAPRRDEAKRRPLAEAAFQRALERQRIAREELMRNPGIAVKAILGSENSHLHFHSPWVPSTRQPLYVPPQSRMNADYPDETYMPTVSMPMLQASQRVDRRIRTEDAKLTDMRERLSRLSEMN